MREPCVRRKMALGDNDEVAEFIEDMLKQLAIMASFCPMSEERRGRIKCRIAPFEQHLTEVREGLPN